MMKVTLSFGGTDTKMIARLNNKGPHVMTELARKIYQVTIALQAHIVNDKLQGQVLQHRTGKLANSIRVIPPITLPDSVIGQVYGAGGPAWYGKIHEYGATVNYMRENKKRGVGTYVTAHFPERSFMRSSLEDMRDEIARELQETAAKAFAE